MPRAVALLRAINVGGRFVVKMDKLRAIASSAGLENVATYIQSGNLLFDCPAREAPRMEARLEALWKKELGWDVTTLVRTEREIAKLVEYGADLAHELKGKDVRHYVGFLRAPLTSELCTTVHGWSYARERLLARERELHFWCTIPTHEAKYNNARLERLSKSPSTMRDWKTVIALDQALNGQR